MAYSTSFFTSSTVSTPGTISPAAPTSSIFSTGLRCMASTRTKGASPAPEATPTSSAACSAAMGLCSMSIMT